MVVRWGTAARFAVLAAGAIMMLALASLTPARAQPGLYIVDTTSDANLTGCLHEFSGDCSLRGAIANANAIPGQIIFANFTTPLITITSPLPVLAAPMVINPSAPPDGYIEIRGTAAAGDAFKIVGPAVTIQNLVINGFSAGSGVVINGNAASGAVIRNNRIGLAYDGIHDLGNSGYGVVVAGVATSTVIDNNIIAGNDTGGIILQTGAQFTTITGNKIGVNITGADFGNTGDGIKISGSPNNTIGGTTTAAQNLIAGNSGDGIDLTGATSTGNVIRGNRIGLGTLINQARPNTNGIDSNVSNLTIDENVISGNSQIGINLTDAVNTSISSNLIGTQPSGDFALGNGIGIFIRGTSHDNDIGVRGEPPNVISGNSSAGITTTATTFGNRFMGNYIGVADNGNSPLGNGSDGIQIAGSDNEIGTGGLDGRNIIGANQAHGMLITGSSATGNEVRLNNIGLGLDGTTALGNGEHGIRILGGASDNVINFNALRNNGGDGISVEGNSGVFPARNELTSNAWRDNAGLGIDLNDDGVTVNDALDADSGPNALQNFPVITSATTAKVDFTLDAQPDTSYAVDRGVVSACDGSGHGEFLGGSNNSTTVTTDASGHAEGSISFSTVTTVGHFAVTQATRLDDGTREESSEFSACMQIVEAPPETPTPTPSPTPSPSPTFTPTPVGQTPGPETPTPTLTATPAATVSPTTGPSGSVSATATPTASGTASVTATLSPTRPAEPLHGDIDCDGDVDEDDALALLMFAGELGDLESCLAGTGTSGVFAPNDVNCDSAVDELDALFVLASLIGAPLQAAAEGCPPVGSPA